MYCGRGERSRYGVTEGPAPRCQQGRRPTGMVGCEINGLKLTGAAGLEPATTGFGERKAASYPVPVSVIV
jgi:hypothetical protein